MEIKKIHFFCHSWYGHHIGFEKNKNDIKDGNKHQLKRVTFKKRKGNIEQRGTIIS